MRRWFLTYKRELAGANSPGQSKFGSIEYFLPRRR